MKKYTIYINSRLDGRKERAKLVVFIFIARNFFFEICDFRVHFFLQCVVIFVIRNVLFEICNFLFHFFLLCVVIFVIRNVLFKICKFLLHFFLRSLRLSDSFSDLNYFTIFVPHKQFFATLDVSPKLKIRLRSHQMRVNLQLSTSFSTGSNVKNTIRVFSSTLPTLDPA